MAMLIRPLSVLLAASMALAGRTIDLCACDGDLHGSLCAVVEEPPAPRGCCGPHARREPATPAPALDASLRAVGCGCPVVQLTTVDADATPSLASVSSELMRTLTLDLSASERTVESQGLAAASARSPPPEPGGLGRHLLLRVLRC